MRSSLSPHRARHMLRHSDPRANHCLPIGSRHEAIVSALNLEVTTPRDLSRLPCASSPATANKGVVRPRPDRRRLVRQVGAAAMAGMAALRAGAGLSTVAIPGRVLDQRCRLRRRVDDRASAGNRSRLDQPGCGAERTFSDLTKPMTVVAIGPGIGRNPETGAVRSRSRAPDRRFRWWSMPTD